MHAPRRVGVVVLDLRPRCCSARCALQRPQWSSETLLYTTLHIIAARRQMHSDIGAGGLSRENSLKRAFPNRPCCLEPERRDM